MTRTTAWFACAIIGVLPLCGCSLAPEPAPAEPPPAVVTTAALPAGCIEPVHQPFPPEGIRAAVEQPPERITWVGPSYPEAARDRRVSGVVLHDVLVCEHGRVVRTVVRGSIPMLDAAAAECLAQWTFKPAMDGGRQVAAWIEVPIRFSLH